MNSIKWIIALSILGLFACDTSEDIAINECDITVDFDGSSIRFCSADDSDSILLLERPQDDFIWQAMNLYYYYQSEVNTLSDSRFGDYDELYTYLNSFQSSEELFYDGLLSSSDRFSWMVEDYVELENSFQGITISFGYAYRLLRESEGSNNLFAFIEYVVEAGPAENAGLRRGDIFNRVNGNQLTVDNYSSLLLQTDSYELTLAILENNEIFSGNRKVVLSAVQLTENPIYLEKILDLDGQKVGYLVYNQFVSNNEEHRKLNEVFGRFDDEGISDLILDLRYNPGGALRTTRILASMILGNEDADAVFGNIIYNEKLSPYFNTTLNFYESLPILNSQGDIVGNEPMNRLTNLSRIFILISGSTASASELLIVGLNPYLDVMTIGTTTVGENEGTAILYDTKISLFLRNENADINDEHSYAIQPIVSHLANSVGFSDYENGLEPDVIIDEKNFLGDLKPLGDPEEPLLAEVLAIINGSARKVSPVNVGASFDHTDANKRMRQKILIDPEYIPKILK